jgi:hypothetical protein
MPISPFQTTLRLSANAWRVAAPPTTLDLLIGFHGTFGETAGSSWPSRNSKKHHVRFGTEKQATPTG